MPSNEGDGGAGQNAPFKILVIGGSYAGLAATVNLLDLCHGKPPRFNRDILPEVSHSRQKISVQITIVDERDGYYHLIGAPLAFASEEYAERTWRRFGEIPALQTPEVRLIHGRVVSVDCEKKVSVVKEVGTDTNIEEGYDFLIASSGLSREWPSAPVSLDKESWLLEARHHVNKTKAASDGVVIIGGGAVGIEMAAELKLVQPERKVTLIHSRSSLLSSEPLPDEFRDSALSLLHDAGVETIMNSRVTQIPQTQTDKDAPTTTTLILSNGKTVKAGHVITAISRFSPTSSYLPAAVLDKEGYVNVHSTLDFKADIPNAQYHYAAGDIAKWSGIKRAGAAMHHGFYAAVNIYQRMLSDSMGVTPNFVELQEAMPSMGLAVGNKAAAYSPLTGVSSGQDVRELYFGDDLGFNICWNYMKLGSSQVSRA